MNVKRDIEYFIDTNNMPSSVEECILIINEITRRYTTTNRIKPKTVFQLGLYNTDLQRQISYIDDNAKIFFGESFTSVLKKRQVLQNSNENQFNTRSVTSIAKYGKDYGGNEESACITPTGIKMVKTVNDMNVNNALLDKKISYWQQQLLDYGKRNKMMHFRETALTTLNIVSPDFDHLFERLVIMDQTLTFRRPIGKADDPKAFSLVSLLQEIDKNVVFANGDIETKSNYETCRRACSNLKNRSELALAEQGTNILYLSFGFIEWRRKIRNNGDDEWMKSPLILVPVRIIATNLVSPYTIKRRDEDIVVNPTLDHYFKEQYKVSLPYLEANPKLKDINRFMDEVEILANERGWRIKKECCIGLMSFLKITMYNDLVNNEKEIKNNLIIRAFAGERNAVNTLDESELMFDHDRIPSSQTFQVMDADSSQQDAIELSKRNISFVLQGPPGTGKSQTITNIIAEGLAAGKKILFVSEKLAALEVVYRRLKDAKLDEFCLPLHNHKANKKDVINEIAHNLQLARFKVKSDEIIQLQQLDILKEKLDEYVVEVHKPIQPLDVTLYDVYGIISEQDGIPTLKIDLDNIEQIDKSRYYQLVMLVKQYDNAIQSLGNSIDKNPWIGSKITVFSVAEKELFLNKLKSQEVVISKVQETVPMLSDTLTLNNFKDYRVIQDCLKGCQVLPSKWFEPETIRHNMEQEKGLIYKLNNLSDQTQVLRNQILEHFDDDFLDFNAGEMKNAMLDAMRILSFHYPETEDEIFERKDGIRKSIEDMLESVGDLKSFLTELHMKYGFKMNSSVSSLGNYIRILKIMEKQYAFTDYYLINGNLDVKKTVEYIRHLMSESFNNKYIISKDYSLDLLYDSNMSAIKNELMQKESYIEGINLKGKFQPERMDELFDQYQPILEELDWILNGGDFTDKELYVFKNNSLIQIKNRLKTIEYLINNPEVLNHIAYTPLLDEINQNDKRLTETKSIIQKIVDRYGLQYEIEVLDIGVIDEISNLSPGLYYITGIMMNNSNAFTILEEVHQKVKEYRQAKEEFIKLREMMSVKTTITNKELIELFVMDGANMILCRVNSEWLYGTEAVRTLILTQKKRQEELKKMYDHILSECDQRAFEIDAYGILDRFKNEYAKMHLKIFNRNYKTDRDSVTNISKKTQKLTDSEIVELLEELREYNDLLKTYESASESVKKLLNIESYDIWYDWNDAERNVDNFEKVVAIISDPFKTVQAFQNGYIYQMFTLSNKIHELSDIVENSIECKEIFKDEYQGLDTDFDYFFTAMNTIESTRRYFKSLDSLHEYLSNPCHRNDMNNLKSSIIEYRRLIEWFTERQSDIKTTTGVAYRNGETDWETIILNSKKYSLLLESLGEAERRAFENKDIQVLNVLNSYYSSLLKVEQYYCDIYSVETVSEEISQEKIVNVIQDIKSRINDIGRVLEIYQFLDQNRLRRIEKQHITRIISDLDLIIKVQENDKHVEEYDARNHLMIGSAYQGFDTDWELIQNMIDASTIISETLNNEYDNKFLNAVRNQDVDFDSEYIIKIERIYNEFIQNAKDMRTLDFITVNSLGDYLEDMLYSLDFLKYCDERINKYSSETLVFKDKIDSLGILADYQKNRQSLSDTIQDFNRLLPEFEIKDISYISLLLNNFENLRILRKEMVSLSINNDFIQWLAEEKENIKLFADAMNRLAKYENDFIEFTELFNNASKLKNKPFSKLKEDISIGIYYYDMVGQTLDLRECERRCKEAGLDSFILNAKEYTEYYGKLDRIFIKSFHYAWLNKQANYISILREFKPAVQNANVKEYARLDLHRLDISKKRVAEKVIHDMPTRDSGIGNGEMSILINEMNKRSGIMPLRRLFEKIPNLLLALKPCLMMSPLSVSYFLESKKYKFDMVIFDEASQIFPQDAIGALSRGKQVIIVGDTKQLPPTNFFNTKTIAGDISEDDDESIEDSIVSDSILEEANNHLISRSLLWHYRSRNEDLISFSNKEIYQDNLITFPSSRIRQKDNGVEYIYVNRGVYKNSVNEEEAKQCLELVKEHIETYPNRSLGIIAFSEKQQALIEEKIYRFRLRNKQYEEFFSDDKDEPFFVKNLENVQGDERDTIIFSICYAKDDNGRLYYRFGPLGTMGGERRLNVAITRAKYNVKLVGSLLPNDMDLNRINSEGVKQLRNYIGYALNGLSALTDVKEETSFQDSDAFITSVSTFIKSKGFDVQINVGDSDYKVNIAVLDPNDKNHYIAGIECDGDTYLMARTSRDRDNLRPRVLKNMGWSMYHLWSTEWVRNPDGEKQNLINFLRKAKENSKRKDI